ncbi:hypothetical protein [Marilutibacter chinensis]|uniref:SPOR domain-containing protein n=1 Tax=Marilutibacter chinensis TaxID=2912247 RepID=A0ABS9HTI1_9GAMM|nr:hypothetical protein [Lysobacter chinensis]MCF7221392.1 hypothetical protein [Lysobacter chinensis]
MLIRALIVFLAVLNLGVAAWWTFRADPMPPTPEPVPLGVARLQLVSEQPPPAVDDREASGNDVAAPEPVEAVRCFSFGPFDTDAAALARTALAPMVVRIVPRQQEEGETQAWRVYLPPFADADDVQAAARALSEAGISDMFVVRNGIEAHSIALGRYGSETAAQRRVAALAEKGFNARLAPIGSGPARVWFDVDAGPDFDPARAQTAAGASGHEQIECLPTP